MTIDEENHLRAKRRGDRVRALEDHELIDQAGTEGVPYDRNAAIAELQRRGAERLNKSVNLFTDASSRQANVMSGLTVAILVLTVVLVVVEVVGCLAQP